MVRIGLLSDTHIPLAASELPREIRKVFQGVDLILHAGDIFTGSVLDELELIAPVLAAKGDDDYGDTLADGRVKLKHTLSLEGLTLRLIHESESYYSLTVWAQSSPPLQTGSHAPDVIVFGHMHRPIVEHHSGILFVNPGSPTFLNYRRGLGTVALLDIGDGKAQASIVPL